MTQQFQFGDRIRNALVPNLTFIYLRKDSPTTCICLDETAQEKRMIATDMELVPHPDTERLDWLIENQAYVVHELPDADCAYFSVSLHTGVQTATGSTARQAIDAAMREQAV